jgi:hypothetical protein
MGNPDPDGVIEAKLIAEIEAAIAAMTANGKPPPAQWVVERIVRERPTPSDMDPMLVHCWRAGLNTLVRRCLGLPEESAAAEDQPLSPEELRAQAERYLTHAEELCAYQKSPEPWGR